MKPAKLRCRAVQELLQDQRDRGVDPGGPSAPPQVREHLEECERCRRFARFLGGFPQALGDALEEAVGAGRPVTRRLGLRPALRWGLAAAGVLLTAGLTLGTLDRYYTVRGVRGEIARLVEDVYAQPLLADAESALRRSRGELSDYLQAYGAETLDWLEDAAAGPLPN
jgi:hypothetical protein